MERHGRELEGQPHREHQPAEAEHRHFPRAPRADDVPEGGRHAGQAEGAERPAEKTDPIEHDPSGPGSVHGVLEGRLGTRLPPLEQAGQRIRGHARHFHRHEHHQQVVGRGHQAHAERRTEDEDVEVGAVLAVGYPRDGREQDVEDEKPRKQEPHEGRQRVEDEQATEELRGPRHADVGRCPRRSGHPAEVVPGEPQGDACPAQGQRPGVDPQKQRQRDQQEDDQGRRDPLGGQLPGIAELPEVPAHASESGEQDRHLQGPRQRRQHPAEQEHHHRGRQRQFDAKQRQ